MSIETEEKLLFDVEHAAPKLSLSQRSLWREIKEGRIKVRKIRRRIFIHKAELERYAKGGK